MKFKRSLFLFFVTIFIGIAAFTNRDEDPVEGLVNTLRKWADTNPQEKVYLHTDKPYYVIGDTIWFKAYVTIGSKHQLSALSGAVYVDLINEGDSLTQSLKLPLMAGMAKGNIVLSDTVLREGNYRLRAYTQWMRNAGPEYFYDKTFSVGNSVANTVFAKIDYIYVKVGAQSKVRALIKYTDQKGNPYSGKAVRYELKEGYKSIATGGVKTNELGELSINLPNSKSGKVSSSYLLTSITIAEGENVPKSFPLKTASQQTDVQFFPEGGNFVNGIRSRMAFKATDANGLGTTIKGIIVDNENKEISKIETEYLGMGYFYIMPEQGKTYKAQITYSDGSINMLKLPEATSEGYTLAVYNNTNIDTILVRIGASTSILQKGDEFATLITQSGGDVQYALNIPIRRAITSVSIPIKNLPSGVLQFTLFTTSGDPINERIVFVQSNDQMDLKLNSSKKEYEVREKVELNLGVKDLSGKPLVGNFSVSVISEDVVPSDETTENSIFSQLLLSSDIKGYIEKPNYYFHNPTGETRANLDMLMLTQGYRRFVWKDLLSGKQVSPIYKAEKLVTNITGKLMSLGNKPIANGKVTLINNKIGLILDTLTDNNGKFKFSNLLITEGIDFTIQGRTNKNGKKLEVLIDKIESLDIVPNKNIGDINPNIPKLLKASIENNTKQDLDLQRHGHMGRGEQLKEVRILANKLSKFGTTINESQADQVFRPNEKQPCKTFRECLEEMENNSVLSFNYQVDTSNASCGPIWIPFTKKGLHGKPIAYQVIIDGMRIETCDFQELLLAEPSNVSKVYFSFESMAISARLTGGRFSGPVMAIYTKNGNFRLGSDPSVVYYAPKGYAAVREFYAPKYDKPVTNDPLADLRSTIYWNPAVLTGSDGKATVSYFNSDNKGTYRVTVEGINADGLLGRRVYRYQVK